MSRSKKFKSDICKIVGHDFGELSNWVDINKRCCRCEIPFGATVMSEGEIATIWGADFYEAK